MLTPCILIVDDEPQSSNVTRTILGEEGYRTDVVDNVDSAIQKLENQNYDLCITDLVMPGKSGLDLLKFIRGSTTLEKLPVIVISGFGSTFQMELMKYHPSRIFTKALDVNDLLWAVRDALNDPTEDRPS